MIIPCVFFEALREVTGQSVISFLLAVIVVFFSYVLEKKISLFDYLRNKINVFIYFSFAFSMLVIFFAGRVYGFQATMLFLIWLLLYFFVFSFIQCRSKFLGKIE